MMETNDYLKWKKWDHAIVSVLFTVAYFLYLLAFDVMVFSVAVPLLGVIFIGWAIIEGASKRPIIAMVIPKYRQLLAFEQTIAPESYHDYRVSFRVSLWFVGIALIVIGLLEEFDVINVDEQALALPVIYPLALIIVNFNVHSRHKRMMKERSL
ncbi:hypothetical protein [Geomicrobium sp. JCM 19039]|uniref:hypothetical protein n=1 Tax=Geomicrobium sp. JCM 19039 TaxID=1460636 RepID=UPI00045F23C3|nr:hypothetical protein [Geomicrobium sp. JCM 19039]GAK13421.1 hypothetical protein JCM19039_3265 [Geomicrobium sp. JCM 19039]